MSTTRRVAVAAVAVAAVLALTTAAPAAAPEPVGARISVSLGAPATYPAGEAFHIRHGWGVGATGQPDQAGLWGFELEVDGVPLEADAVGRTADPANQTVFENVVLNRFWLFNFQSGLSGTHTFTGRWIGPCTAVAEAFGRPGPCTTPNEPVVAIERSLTVEFVRTNLALGKPVTASGEFPGNPPSSVVDGSWWTYWSAGNFPPQWFEVDLGAAVPVAEITLGVTQLPDCHTVHRLYGRATSEEQYALLQEFSGFTVDQQLLAYVAPAPTPLRYVRVETVSSCSWVGWREVEVYGP